MTKSLALMKREGVEFLAPLRSESTGTSREFAQRLTSEARSYGLNMRDYLTVKINLSASENPEAYADLSGYEASLKYLDLPVRDDLRSGISLQAAADTFQTFPGTRALFPEVIDDVVQWKYRQTAFEQVAPMLANSRTINQAELLTTVVNDSEGDYEVTKAIAEGARIPIYSIRSSEQTVSMFKHGMGYKTTYEFERRAQLDLMVPYANRAIRQAEISKVKFATSLLVNGDVLHGAAPVVGQSSFNTPVGSNSVNGQISYKHLLNWLVSRAKAGYPIDTVVGNWDAYIQWLMMFAVPTTDKNMTDAENLARAGFQVGSVPLLTGTVDFVISSSAPAGRLVGYSRADTLEELIESGSQIQESEQSIVTQTMTYVRTETSGYRIVFDATRSVFNYAA